MNKESEDTLRSLFHWLLQDPSPQVSSSSGTLTASEGAFAQPWGPGDLQPDTYDPLDLEGLENLPPILDSSENFSFQGDSPLKLGDGSAVEDRFHTLLKRRLKTEIEQNLPIFPWETEVRDYPMDYVPEVSTSAAAVSPLWQRQLQKLRRVPVPLPQTVLNDVFGQCRELVQTSLRDGERLLRAVDTLFPNDSQLLNELAGRVLVAASNMRFAESEDADSALSTSTLQTTELPATYESATTEQQMALALLAAHEIMETLTLRVSTHNRVQTREWLTAVGSVILETEYRAESPALLMIQAWLPCGGQIKFRGGGVQSVSQRPSAGALSVILPDPHPNQPWALEVELAALDHQPLKFSVSLTETA